ncbi:MAG: hypothetical protein ACE5IO_08940 [Thermoplasmata archaeon]
MREEIDRAIGARDYDLLIRILDSLEGYPYEVGPVHEKVLDTLKDTDDKRIVDWAVNLLSEEHWEVNVQGCLKDEIILHRTTPRALCLAMEIAANNGRTDAPVSYYLDVLRWRPWHQLGRAAGHALVRIRGMDVFEKLAKYLFWDHPKFDCGNVVSVALGAILSIGPEAKARLVDSLAREEEWTTEVVEVLSGIGNEPEDRQLVTSAFLRRLDACDRGDEARVALLSKFPSFITNDSVISALSHSDSRVVSGACVYFQYNHDDKAIDKLTSLSLDPEMIWRAMTALVEIVLSRSKEALPEYVHRLAELIDSLVATDSSSVLDLYNILGRYERIMDFRKIRESLQFTEEEERAFQAEK